MTIAFFTSNCICCRLINYIYAMSANNNIGNISSNPVMRMTFFCLQMSFLPSLSSTGGMCRVSGQLQTYIGE